MVFMADIKKNERYIPTKNYVIAIVLVIAAIFLTWYGFAWNKVRQENKVSVSYFVKNNIISKEITSLDEISSITQEAPERYLVYISYTGSEEIYNLEKELTPIIKDYQLNDYIYFIDVTSIKEDKDYIDKLNEQLGLEEVKITNIPTILYFVDGKVSKSGIITTADGNLMTKSDFQKFLDVNKIEK